MVSAQDIDAAALRLAGLSGVVGSTPLHHSPRLSAMSGLDVWLKREDLQTVRSYKARGAYNLISQLSENERAAGVTCASAGNHAQGVALACGHLSVHARIHLPSTTPRQKRERIADLGGPWVEIVVDGDSYDDAATLSMTYADASGATPVPAFDDPRTIAGQGTIGLEILAQMESPPAAVLAPIGGGGLAAGLLTLFSERAPGTTVVGIEPAGAASMAAALDHGGPVRLGAVDAFVDGAAVREVGRSTYDVVAHHDMPLVSVAEGLVCVEMLALYQADGIIAEPAGALAPAALRIQTAVEAAGLSPGDRVVCVLSGGNNDVSRYADVVERALVFEGLKHYFLVDFPQEPGALRRFLDEVLGPDDDITLFEYIKKSNRETGPALVGIELQRKEDLTSLLERMVVAPIRVEVVEPSSPLFRFVQ